MDLIDEIHKLMQGLSSAYYDNRPDPEFLALLEDGERWVKDMRRVTGCMNNVD